MNSKLISLRTISLLAAVLAGFFILTRLPVAEFFSLFMDESFALQVRYITVSFIIVSLAGLLAYKNDFLKEGGFVSPIASNYWMLFIPLLFPGLFFFSNVQRGCFFQDSDWAMISLVIMSKAIMEEALCRGIIQGYLVKKYPRVSYSRIVMISSLIFALLHFMGVPGNQFLNVFSQVIYAFLTGLVFGALVIRVQNVWLVGVVHGLLNMMSRGCSNRHDAETVSWVDYFISLGSFMLLFSPCIFIYWLLLKTKVDQRAEIGKIR